jgi:hypothetical protein
MMAGDSAVAAGLEHGSCDSAAAVGVLGDVLEGLRFHGTVFFRSELAAPWGVWSDEDDSPRFHIALRGGFCVGREGREAPVRVKESDIILLPRGGVHWMADQPANWDARRSGTARSRTR